LIERRHLLNEQGRSHVLKKELDEWKSYGKLGLIAVGIFLLSKCEGHEIRVSPDNSDVVLHSWSLWGFSRTDTPIIWREDQWMAQDKKGEWYIAVEEPEYDPPDPGP
jgi:hypothetical protein